MLDRMASGLSHDLLEMTESALSPDVKARLREKSAHAIELALDLIIETLTPTPPGVEKRRLTGGEIASLKIMGGLFPKIEHGAGPVTLILQGIPRPKTIDSGPVLKLPERGGTQGTDQGEIVRPGASSQAVEGD